MMQLEIDKDSPLRNFPTNLNPQQGMFLDGIRYSMGMIYIAYNRLAFFLSTITEKIEKKDNSERPSTEALFLYAWVIVDSVYRLRGLIEHMPGIRWCKTAEIKEFLNETTQVEELRHVIQHLRNELKSMTDDLFPVFGNICWIYITDPESEIPIRSCVVSSGKPRQGMVTPNVNVPDR